MAGGQSGGRPGERGGARPADGEVGERLTGGLSGGEWWRVDGPWRVLGAVPGAGAAAEPGSTAGRGAGQQAAEAGVEDGVYLSGSAVPPRPTAPPTAAVPTASPSAGPGIPARRAPHSIFRKRTPAAAARREPAAEIPRQASVAPEEGAPAAWLIAPASPGAGRPPAAADFPGWDAVTIEFPPDDTESAEPPAEEAPVPEQPPGKGGKAGRRGRPGKGAAVEPEPEQGIEAAGELPAASVLAGRRPSPLLLLAAAVLVGGAVSGVILVLLAGWGLAYLSARLGNLTKKFAVFGIPMITMTASSIWFWGRSEGRWGDALAKGAPVTHATLTAAPGVLRLAGVLSAVFLLAVALRRRPLG
ncbi:hypothetical protein OG500_21780 [Kitasatospora sp. NBC_01250]|uniref:hypothetical protein n=1 Tax=Kitasatospora sp. NBC_01250 TaxID=2903571 RepID=UPI002E361040|nr:hypothetical protein [Kitasatospora sp. NBC_01250]